MTTSVPQLATTATRDVRPTAGTRCTACPHPVPDHDVIGLRFCSATRTGDLSRGCVCRSS